MYTLPTTPSTDECLNNKMENMLQDLVVSPSDIDWDASLEVRGNTRYLIFLHIGLAYWIKLNGS